MPKNHVVPDAWDDDWESLADKSDGVAKVEESPEEATISKAERKAKHVERNRELWESADNPQPLLFLQAHDDVPLNSTFKAPVKVLSRKPPPQVLSRNADGISLGGVKLEEDDDSEEERRKKAEEDFAQRKARAEKERAEKLRKYAEAREKIFGLAALDSSEPQGASSNKPTRGKGRGRGGRDSQSRSSNEQSPARPSSSGRQLYDSSYSPKPSSIHLLKKEATNSRPGTPSGLQQPIREPRGPGRGGRGFAPRGNHASSPVQPS